jgi:ferrous iron transport protein A
MLALGITRGAKIEVLRRGPKNNLSVFAIRGAMIALRREEAEKILVT